MEKTGTGGDHRVPVRTITVTVSGPLAAAGEIDQLALEDHVRRVVLSAINATGPTTDQGEPSRLDRVRFRVDSDRAEPLPGMGAWVRDSAAQRSGDRRLGPAYRPADDSPAYRQAIQDAGRGRLLR